jgi:hypothetical protein
MVDYEKPPAHLRLPNNKNGPKGRCTLCIVCRDLIKKQNPALDPGLVNELKCFDQLTAFRKFEAKTDI